MSIEELTAALLIDNIAIKNAAVKTERSSPLTRVAIPVSKYVRVHKDKTMPINTYKRFDHPIWGKYIPIADVRKATAR